MEEARQTKKLRVAPTFGLILRRDMVADADSNGEAVNFSDSGESKSWSLRLKLQARSLMEDGLPVSITMRELPIYPALLF